MNKKNKFLKKSIYVLSVLLIVGCGVLSYILGSIAQTENTYEFYTDNKDIEITSIHIDSRKRGLGYFTSKNTYLTKNKILKINDLKGYFLKLKISQIDEFAVNFKCKESNGKILVYKNKEKYKTISIKDTNDFSDNSYTKDLLTDYLKRLDSSKVISIICISVLFLLLAIIASKYIIDFVINVEEKSKKISSIILYIIAQFIIFLISYYALILIFYVFAIIFILTFFIYAIRKNKNIIKNNLHIGYILIAPTIGLLIMFTLPPFHVPDEPAHFEKAFTSSYISDNSINYKNGTATLPKDVINFIDKYADDVYDYHFKMSSKTYFYDLYKKTNYKKISSKVSDFTNTACASIVAYIPSTIAMFFARILNVNILITYLIGKLINLIIYIVISYFALKNVCKYKKAFFIVCLLPILFQQASGINQDSMTNTLFIFLLYKIINAIYDKKNINKKDIVIFLITSIIFAYTKFGYFPIFFLILLIPNDKFKNEKHGKIIKLLLILIPILLSFANVGKNVIFGSLNSSQTNSMQTYNISYFMSNPKRLILILFNTILERLDLDLVRGLFDGFGWSTKWNSSLGLFICEALFVTLAIVHDKNDQKMSKKELIIFILVMIMNFGIVYASMLFSWTKIGMLAIDGLQSRYFIPITLLLLIILGNMDKIKLKSKNPNMFYVISMIIINIVALYTLINGFYV